jgi:hypothetical protein
MLTAEVALPGDLGDSVASDPEVRQARMIAGAARSRLLASMTGSRDVVDLAEAQRMLDALRDATAHAQDAEDRVLVHRGLLTAAEAGRRASLRRSGSAVPADPPRAVSRAAVPTGTVAHVTAAVLMLVTAGLAGAALARRAGALRAGWRGPRAEGRGGNRVRPRPAWR